MDDTEEEGKSLSSQWPRNGEVKFDSISLTYEANAPLALDEVSFQIKSGQKLGIVGRSGAG